MRQRHHFAAAQGLAVLGAVVTAGCVVSVDSQGHIAREERRFPVTAAPDVRVITFDGSIEIRSWDRPEVVVEIEKRGPSKEAVDALEVKSEQNGNTVQVEVRRPPGRDVFFGIGMHVSRSARIIATVPRRTDLLARSGDGSIRIDRVSGRLELRTGDGSIRGTELSGDLAIHTGDGSVTLEEVDGQLDLTSGDGGVNVAGSPGSLRVRTGDGSITVRANAGSAMTDDWHLTTGDGGVAIYLPPGFNAELDAHTGDGRVSTDLEVATTSDARTDRRTVRGRLGSGGRLLKIRTGDGSIRLRAS